MYENHDEEEDENLQKPARSQVAAQVDRSGRAMPIP